MKIGVLEHSKADIPEDLTSWCNKKNKKFSTEENSVWEKMLINQKNILEKYNDYISTDYVKGFYELNFKSDCIPDLDVINEKLSKIGWIAAYVDGFVPANIYVKLQANNIFPISQHMRRFEHLGHSAAPDCAHDILGHLPMLFCPDYRNYLKKWATIASLTESTQLDRELYEANSRLIALKEEIKPDKQNIDIATKELEHIHTRINLNPSLLSLLTRLYVWSIEYGVIGNETKFRIFGSATMSSCDEISVICNNQVKRRKFSIDILKTDVDYTRIQPQIFVAENFLEYEHLLNLI